MKPLPCLAALLALPAVASDLEPVRLAFTPQAGWDITCTLSESAQVELTSSDSAVLLNREEVTSGEDEDLDLAQTHELELVLRWRDEFRAVDGGVPTELRRTLLEVSGAVEGRMEFSGGELEEVFSAEFESPLEGLAVLFTREEEGEDYAVEWDGEEGDDELLEGLSIDAFATWFLPEGEVQVGESWEVGAEAWRDLKDIGGDLSIALDTDEAEGEGPDGDELERRLRDSAEGAFRCTFEGLREVDGRELCVIALEGEIRCAAELEDSYVDEEGDDIEVRASREQEYELTGELLWDAALGRARSLELQGSAEFHEVSTESFESEEGTIGFREDERFAVELRVELAYE